MNKNYNLRVKDNKIYFTEFLGKDENGEPKSEVHIIGPYNQRTLDNIIEFIKEML